VTNPGKPVDGEWKAKVLHFQVVDEGRKRVLLIAASILAARKLAGWDGRPSPAVESAISDAIALAERLLSRIDARWPARQGRENSNTGSG
jgi:hypothetical protein